MGILAKKIDERIADVSVGKDLLTVYLIGIRALKKRLKLHEGTGKFVVVAMVFIGLILMKI